MPPSRPCSRPISAGARTFTTWTCWPRSPGEIGLDPEEARKVLADGRFADMVREEEALWTGRGIHAVPAMVFAGRYLVSGAQGVANYSEILQSSAPTSRV